MRRYASATALAVCVAWAAAAQATPSVTVLSTEVQAYNGTSPYNFFGGSSWGNYIGNPPFNTSGLTVSDTANSITFAFKTGFTGTDNVAGTNTYAADIFLQTETTEEVGTEAAIAASGFNLAISLGINTPDGGNAAGVYTGFGTKTSQNIWSTRTNYIYGGQYGAPGNSQATPTVATGGAMTAGLTVTNSYDNTAGTFDVTVTGNSVYSVFGNNLDLLWGTGDCSNSPIFAEVTLGAPPPSPVPEPLSLALLGAGLAALGLLWRRHPA